MKFVVNLDLNQNELRNAVLHPLATAPSNPKDGQIYYNSSDGYIYRYHNNAWGVVGYGDMKASVYDPDGGAKQVAFKDDTRFTDARTPTAHKNSHKTGGSDAITPADIGAYVKPSAGIPKSDLDSSVQTSLGKADTALQSFTETDPVFVASPAHGISSTDISSWNAKIDSSSKGQANGVAELDSSGKVPSGQLPSYVDDVVEAYVRSEATALSSTWLSKTNGGAALTPESDKIYIIVGPSDSTYLNKQYRWGGSTYALCNPSDVNSVNGKTGIVVLSQDDVGDGTTYKRFSQTEKTKLSGIDTGATANTITLNGTATKTPSFYAPTGAGTSGQVLTSNGSGAPTWQAAPESVHKYTATNSALTASGGAWTWTITVATHGISNNVMFVSLYEVSTGAQVMADIAVNQSTYAVTITIVDSASAGTLSAGTYRVVMLG